MLEDELKREKMGPMYSENISNQNFRTARMRSFFKSIYSRLKREDDCLPALGEILDITNAKNEKYVGLCSIPVANIIGSEGRYEDFNKDFFPKKERLRSRWSAIDQILEQDQPLPAISVFKIDEYYFVRDGNHRVSVAKSRGQEFIDAEVTEYVIDVPITKELTVEDRFKIQEHARFLEITGLGSLGRGLDIKLTRPRSYRLLLNIIQHFSQPLQDLLDREMTTQEVALEWYYRIFLPFAEGAYLDDLLEKFSNRTTGDLYVWIQMNWEDVKDSLGERMTFLAKPPISDSNTVVIGAPGELIPFVSGMTRNINSQYLRANIGLVVTCSIVNISKQGDISVAIVKRKYHPFEDYWSLPIGMFNEQETRSDVAKRCVRHSLGIQKKIKFVQYETFDNVDRTPFGRMIAFGMIGIYYGDKLQMSAGGLASEIKLISLHEKVPLVYDHNKILTEALNYLHRIRNNINLIEEIFPDDIPLKYIRKLLSEVRAVVGGEA
jgi:ADP-ribose pyrophosphatase YjhB (NUDIX family)